MKSRRIENGMKYAAVTSLFGIIAAVLGMVRLQLFLTNYGSAINGIYQLFVQLTSYLSLMDFGFGAIVTHYMYKYSAENNRYEICRLFNGAKKMAFRVFYSMLLILICISVLIPFLSKELNNDYLYSFVFILFCFPITLKQLFSPFKSIMDSNQQSHEYEFIEKVSLNCRLLISIFLMNYINFFQLILFECFIETIFWLIEYNFLKIKNQKYISLTKDSNEETFVQSKHLVINRLSGLAIANTDNLIISSMKSFSQLSVFTTYNYVNNTILSIISPIIYGFTNGFGNLFISNDGNEKNIINTFTKIVMMIGLFLSINVIIGIQPFINLFTRNLETSYHVNDFEIFIIGSYLFYVIYAIPFAIFVNVKARFKQINAGLVLEAICNVMLSIFLINEIGIFGALLGTVLAKVFISFPNYYIAQSDERCSWEKILLAYTPLILGFLIIFTIQSNLELISIVYLPWSSYINWVFNMLLTSLIIIIIFIPFILLDKHLNVFFRDLIINFVNLIFKKK
ncbi:MAG: oligosaccharide flippase family protein [Bacilli bacterium]